MTSPVNWLFDELPADADDSAFDLAIAACGFESRASFITESMHTRVGAVHAFTYPSNRILGFEANVAHFSNVGTLHNPTDLAAFESAVRRVLNDASAAGAQLKVAVDISTFDRDRLGAIVRALAQAGERRALLVDFVYAIGAYESHREAVAAVVLVNRPVRGFEGWSTDATKPVACVLGLGFERELALAALETLEPARTVAFVADGLDVRFETRVHQDNIDLIQSSELVLQRYSLKQPNKSLHQIEDVVYSLQGAHRPVLVPLGPKLFALLCLLVAAAYGDSVAVWRVSADDGGDVNDRVATGEVVGLRVSITPGESESTP